jgi:hypothetical protein
MSGEIAEKKKKSYAKRNKERHITCFRTSVSGPGLTDK